ncbi:MAG: FecR family protein, partial [Gammaproteobacteria bacterium]
ICIMLMGAPLVTHAAEVGPAARIDEIEGKVLATDMVGHARLLGLNDAVYAAETVATLGRARAILVFTDASKYELGPDTRFRIDRYHYTKNPDEDGAATRVLKGFFRYVSGAIAELRPRSVGIAVSVATIGIRGTHLVGEVTETSARIGLLEPEKGDAPSAIEVANAYGTVTISQPGYATEIASPTSAPTPPRLMDLRSMTRNLRAVQTIRRVIVPHIPHLR